MASSMYETIVNSLSAHVAVLNNNGLIIETNRAWQQFAARICAPTLVSLK